MENINQFQELFNNLLQLSPPIALALVINFILFFVGKIPHIKSEKDWLLPLCAMLLGGLVYPCVAEIGKVSYSVKSPGLFNVIIGLCIGGLAVAAHGTFKSILKKIFNVPTGDTMIFTKEETKQ